MVASSSLGLVVMMEQDAMEAVDLGSALKSRHSSQIAANAKGISSFS
jgi:hypothetical protein